ncbi:MULTISPECIES: cupin domain-containing protein [Micromonospora]|uniref:cupin domain-containing protein n=1 Tax=Micromonospora TaxID=1873 RepID=UPI000696A2C5|nr:MULTISPECIES: cupin domain-containing protein [Micromonospora]
MPRAGDMIENTMTGERAVFRSTRHETDGKLLEADYHLTAGGYVAAAHVHPRQEETFEVLEGKVRIRIGGREILAEPGRTYVVPPGVAHRIVNHTSASAHLYSTLRPAMLSDELLQTMWALASDGRTNRRGIPGILQAAVSGAHFRGELYLAGPPLWLQDLVFRTLAPLGRALGYRGVYESRTAPVRRPVD